MIALLLGLALLWVCADWTDLGRGPAWVRLVMLGVAVVLVAAGLARLLTPRRR